MSEKSEPRWWTHILFSMTKTFLVVVTFFFALTFGIGMLSEGVRNAVEESPLAGGKVAETAQAYQHFYGNETSGHKFLKLSVQGPILGMSSLGDDPWGLMSQAGVTYGYNIKERFEKAARDPEILGVILHVNTPGGTIFGSKAIYRAILDYRVKTTKPVYVYIEGLAASGGVMAMVSADKIFADEGSLIGSIGVLGPTFLYFDQPKAIDGGLLGGGISTEGGIEITQIAAGRGKDAGSPYRRLTEEEQTVWQANADALYEDFIRHVALERGIDASVIRDEMGAHAFHNDKAEAYGLIDGTASFDRVAEAIATAVGVQDYQVVTPMEGRGASLASLFFGRFIERAPQVSTALERVAKDLCAMANMRMLAYAGYRAELCPTAH